MKVVWRIFILFALVGSLQAGTASAGLLGVNFLTPFSTLYDVDPATGGLSNPRSTTPAGALSGIALNSAGTLLYGFTPVLGNLVTINPVTGATSVVGPTGLLLVEGDLAFGPTGTLYGADAISGATQSLVSFNLTTGAATIVGTLATDDISGLAFSSGGTFYGLDTHVNSGGNPTLVTINPATGAVLTNVATTGLSAVNSLAGMTFDANGTLYVTGGGSLYTLNPVTGAATLVGTHSGDLSGLAFVPSTTVPEPATIVLLALGLAILSSTPRRKLH